VVRHHRKKRIINAEQALAADVLKSAVQEIKATLVHVRSADTLELKKAHLVSVATMWRFCVRSSLWHELCDVDPDAMADKLHELVNEVEYEQIVVAYRQMRLEELAEMEEEDTT
jgi:hypothetical protein